MNKTNIAFIGVGGVGGFIAGEILDCALENVNVNLLARGRHLQAIKDNGLRVIGKNSKNKIVYPDNSLENIDDLKDIDVFIIAVKAYDLKEVLIQLKDKINDNTIIMPLMNGMDIYKRTREVIKNGIVLPSCIYISSKIKKPGVIELISDDYSLIFGNDEKYADFNLDNLLNIFDSCKLNYDFVEDPISEIWRKYLFIASFSLVTSLNDNTIGEVLENKELKKLTIDIMYEILKLAKVMDVNISEDAIEESINKAKTFPKSTKTSLQRDIISKKEKNELNIFAESIIDLANEFNVKIPKVRSVYNKLK